MAEELDLEPIDSDLDLEPIQDPNTPITNKFGGYFKPKTIDPETGSVIPDYVPGYDATRDLFQTTKEPPLTLEEAVRLGSTAATFGQQPRISALTESLISDKPYGQALTENQAMLEYIRKKNPVASKAIEIPVSLATTAPLQGASMLGRIGIGAGLGAGYGSEQQDLTTSEGIINAGAGAILGGGTATIPSVLKGGSDFVKKTINEASEGGTTVKNLIRDYIVKKNKPELVKELVSNPKKMMALSEEGLDKAQTRLGEAVYEYKSPAAANANPSVDPTSFLSEAKSIKNRYTSSRGTSSLDPTVSRAINSVEETFSPIVKKTESQGLSFNPNNLEINPITKTNVTQQVNISPKDMGVAVKKLDDAINYARANGLSEDEFIASQYRNKLKETFRKTSPDAEAWAKVDDEFSTFLDVEKPAVESLEQAKFDYAKRKAQSDFPQLSNDMASGRVFPSKTGLFSKALDLINPGGGLKYTDQISEDIATKLVDPDMLMQLIQQGDKEIIPNVRPTGILKALQALGALDQDVMGASTYNALGNVLASQSPKIMNEE